MARSRENLDLALTTLLAGFGVMGILIVIGMAFTVRWSVGRGLVPLGRIARETSNIESTSLSHRFPVEDLPQELVPICKRLNELLGRLESAFQRERRFNADVAHELRTPLAELRTLAEVALNRTGDSQNTEETRACFADVLDIALQMEMMVTTLLSLVRCETGRRAVNRESLDISALIKETVPSFREEARKRNVSFEINLPEKAVVTSDRFLLSAILKNLFSNAVGHAPEKGSVCCEVTDNGGGYSLSLRNSNLDLEQEDLEHILEPFWQKDRSRTDTTRNGLGLSLVATYAELLGLKLLLSLPEPEQFEVTFKLPSPP